MTDTETKIRGVMLWMKAERVAFDSVASCFDEGSRERMVAEVRRDTIDRCYEELAKALD